MKLLKRILKWLKYPRAWWFFMTFILLIGAVAGVFLFLTVIGTGTEYDFWAYIIYFLSATLVVYNVYCVIYFIPKAKILFQRIINRHDFTKRLAEQYGFRTIIFSVVSFSISMGNAVVNGTLGILESSAWFIALGVYYLLLAIMRGGVLLFHSRKKFKKTPEQIKLSEIRTYQICGIILMFLPIVLSVAIWEMYVSGRAFVHAGLMIYFFATYTTYKVVMTTRNFIISRRSDDMTVRAIRNINVADTLVSLLALQTAMFHEFSPESNLSFGNGVMGAIICALSIAIGIFMLVRGSINIKKLRETI